MANKGIGSIRQKTILLVLFYFSLAMGEGLLVWYDEPMTFAIGQQSDQLPLETVPQPAMVAAVSERSKLEAIRNLGRLRYNKLHRIRGAHYDLPTSFQSAKVGDEREVGGVKLRWCPPGRFRMGSPESEPEHRPDEMQVEVRLTKGFWMGKYEVTQGQWKRVVGEFPQPQPAGEGDNYPLCWVNYLEAEDFCQKLTAMGHKSGELPKDWEFRLPTEAQWEYACRAGTTTATSFGDKFTSKQANFLGSKPYNGSDAGPALHRATPVGSYPANAWGLYDMHGNVFEWCRDWYHAQLPGGDDPDLSARKGTANRDGTFSRARRGGAWDDEGKYLRSAFRLRYEPERRADHIGFRVVAVQR